jgi:hypothetical protein
MTPQNGHSGVGANPQQATQQPAQHRAERRRGRRPEGERRSVQPLELVWTVGTPSVRLVVAGLVATVIWLAWRRGGRS